MISRIFEDFRRTWPQLAITDVLAKVVGFVLLTPAAGILLGLLVSRRGGGVVTDEDILFFFLRPLGLVILILGGAILIGIGFVEQAGLMTIGFGARHDRSITYYEALRHVVRRAASIFNLAGQMVARLLLYAAPFLVAGGLVYLLLLTEFDINYYLAEKPPEFYLAAVLIGLVVVALVIVLARLVIGWAYALPLVLFENEGGAEALKESRDLAAGNRPRLAWWLIGWAVLSLLAATLVTAGVGAIARLVIPEASESLTAVVVGTGTAMVVSGVLNLLVSFVTGAIFSLLIVNLWWDRADSHGEQLVSQLKDEPLGTKASWKVPKKALLWGAVAAAVAAIVIGLVLAGNAKVEDRAVITAHRGSSGGAPENTLAAIEGAITDGADWVEFDVQEIADGTVVVWHDSDFKRIAGVDRKIWDVTPEELLDIDIGSWFSPEFQDQRVPTLVEVLDLCKGKIKLNIELKYYGHNDRLEEKVIEQVEAAGLESDVVLMSLKQEQVERVQQLRPGWPVGLLTAVALGDLTKLEVDFYAVNTPIARRRFIRNVHGLDREIYVWTVNEPVQMAAMMSLGVDNIITDEPALARSVLEERAEMNQVERMILLIAGRFGIVPPREGPSTEADA
ncbi:MAG: glycerophosphodiester phosphodiesterase [Thermoanaerobaculia bacterium]